MPAEPVLPVDNAIGRIFRKTEVLDCGESLPSTAKDAVADASFALPELLCRPNGEETHTLSYLTVMKNRTFPSARPVATPTRSSMDAGAVVRASDANHEQTQWIVTEMKALQLQVDTLRQDAAMATLSVSLADPLGLAANTPAPSRPKAGAKARRGHHEKVGRSPPGTDDESPAAPTNPLTAGKAIRQRIASMRADHHLLAELSEQCDQWVADAKIRRQVRGANSGGYNFVLMNAQKSSRRAHTYDGKTLRLEELTAENTQRHTRTRNTRRQIESRSYALKTRDLNRKLLRLAMIQGTLSTKQCMILTSARLWSPIYVVWFFARRCMENVMYAGRLRQQEDLLRRTDAVRCLEGWWLKNQARHVRGRRSLAMKFALPWRDRARSAVITRSYVLLSQFMKDWVNSKKVVEAVKRVLRRTRKIQRWFTKVVLVRRAKKALWLAQWCRCEEKSQSQRDTQAAKVIRRHKVGDTPPVSSCDPAPPYKERRVSFVPKKPEIDLQVYKRLVALPSIPERLRMEAVSRELLVWTRRHIRKVYMWETEVMQFEAAVAALETKREQMRLAGIADTHDEQQVTPPPPPPRPRMLCLLPQADLARLIDVTSKKFATDIANKVADDMEARGEGPSDECRVKAFSPVPPRSPAAAMRQRVHRSK